MQCDLILVLWCSFRHALIFFLHKPRSALSAATTHERETRKRVGGRERQAEEDASLQPSSPPFAVELVAC